jgi:hypothetical protein
MQALVTLRCRCAQKHIRTRTNGDVSDTVKPALPEVAEPIEAEAAALEADACASPDVAERKAVAVNGG